MSTKAKQQKTKMTAVRLAYFTGYTDTRIRQLEHDGIIPPKNENGEYNFVACNRAIIAYLQTLAKQAGKTSSEARDKKLKEETEWLQMRNLEKRDRLFPVAMHKRIQGAVINASRSRFLSIPARVAEKVPTRCQKCNGSLDDVRAHVRDHAQIICTEALQELSTEKLDGKALTKASKRRRT